ELGVAVMEHVTTLSQCAKGVVDSVAGHLSDPRLGGVTGDAGDGNATRLQVEKEENVVCDQAAPGQDLNREEVCADEDRHVRCNEVLPTRTLTPFRCRVDAVALQDVSNRLVGDVVAEIGQRAGDPIVSPTYVLLGHAEDECFDSSMDARASRVGAMLGSVEL